MPPQLSRVAGAVVLAAVALAGPAAAPGCAAPPGPRLIALGTLGGPTAAPIDINGRGQVIGVSETADRLSHAFLWEHGTIRELTVPGPVSTSIPFDINDRGQAVGFAELGYRSPSRPYLWNNGVATELATFGGTGAQAEAINERGQIVGSADIPGLGLHAVLWDDAGIHDLGPRGPYVTGNVAINGRGQVTFQSGDHPVLWDRGRLTDVGTAFPADPGTIGFPVALADDGTVVANSNGGDTGPGRLVAFVWRAGRTTVLPGTSVSVCPPATRANRRGQIIGGLFDSFCHAALRTEHEVVDLGTLGGSFSFAAGLNDSGTVVGNAATGGDARTRAFRWERGSMTDIGALPGDTDSEARGINNAGQIIGTSIDNGSDLPTTHAFLYSPAPR